jgi:hypothetical protein
MDFYLSTTRRSINEVTYHVEKIPEIKADITLEAVKFDL